MQPCSATAANIERAARRIRDGGLVVFPTDTVYGIAARADAPAAIARLNRVKGRPPSKPYTIHLGARAQLSQYVTAIPQPAQRLMDAFWPGPLTLVLPDRQGGATGFRLPNHPVALALLGRCDCPVVAPSANHAEAPPPTTAAAAEQAVGCEVDLILDAGPTTIGQASTVVAVDADGVRVLRDGAVSRRQLAAVVALSSGSAA